MRLLGFLSMTYISGFISPTQSAIDDGFADGMDY